MVDHDAFWCAGMSEVTVFEVDTHVVEGSFFPFGEVEKDKISRFQTTFSYTLAVFIIDINNRTL